jgi:hypothetical protein
MAITTRSKDAPDETKSFPNLEVEVMNVGSFTFGRYTFQPGWRWSENIKPIVKTASCQTLHVGYALSGRLHVVSDDGTEAEIGPGELYQIEPGHDGWVVGDEPVVWIELIGADKHSPHA